MSVVCGWIWDRPIDHEFFKCRREHLCHHCRLCLSCGYHLDVECAALCIQDHSHSGNDTISQEDGVHLYALHDRQSNTCCNPALCMCCERMSSHWRSFLTLLRQFSTLYSTHWSEWSCNALITNVSVLMLSVPNHDDAFLRPQSEIVPRTGTDICRQIFHSDLPSHHLDHLFRAAHCINMDVDIECGWFVAMWVPTQWFICVPKLCSKQQRWKFRHRLCIAYHCVVSWGGFDSLLFVPFPEAITEHMESDGGKTTRVETDDSLQCHLGTHRNVDQQCHRGMYPLSPQLPSSYVLW